MIEKLDNAIFSNDYIVFGDLDSDFVAFFSSGIGVNSLTLANINLDDNNFDDCDPETFNYVKLMPWHNKYEQRNASKK